MVGIIWLSRKMRYRDNVFEQTLESVILGEVFCLLVIMVEFKEGEDLLLPLFNRAVACYTVP